jgi:sigma-B regulation protein RsbU (phosphoserine phosphatase)
MTKYCNKLPQLKFFLSRSNGNPDRISGKYRSESWLFIATCISMTSESPLILVADDDKSTRILLRLILQQEGYEIVEAENGQECLIAWQEHQPDMILLDAMMPVMDGFSCCQHIREKQEQDLTIPLLMITGLNDKESVDRAFAAGATDYITKPIHPPVLRQRLK